MNTLTLACTPGERTRAILDGTVRLPKHQLSTNAIAPEELFRIAFEAPRFDISELSFSLYLMHLNRGDCQYVGLPIFPSRVFRHSAIYVRADSDIRDPAQLKGKTVGVRNYLNTAALVVRGLLADEYGVNAPDIDWIIGDVDEVQRSHIDVPKLLRPANIREVTGTSLAEMLRTGAIDAIVHHSPPADFGKPTSGIKRLFDDPTREERNYFARTGIFPIMHLMGVHKSALAREPGLVADVFNAFAVTGGSSSAGTFPPAHADGVKNNIVAIETLVRYAYDQGFIGRRLATQELFPQELLNT